eukprot:1142088-Pelagomonas_calceolata.AAC.7
MEQPRVQINVQIYSGTLALISRLWYGQCRASTSAAIHAHSTQPTPTCAHDQCPRAYRGSQERTPTPLITDTVAS